MDPGQKKAATSAQEDGGDSDEDWSRGGKTSKSKKGGKAKKGVNLLLVLPVVLGKGRPAPVPSLMSRAAFLWVHYNDFSCSNSLGLSASLR